LGETPGGQPNPKVKSQKLRKYDHSTGGGWTDIQPSKEKIGLGRKLGGREKPLKGLIQMAASKKAMKIRTELPGDYTPAD